MNWGEVCGARYLTPLLAPMTQRSAMVLDVIWLSPTRSHAAAFAAALFAVSLPAQQSAEASHWSFSSFRDATRSAKTSGDGDSSASGAIDRFVAARLLGAGHPPQPAADRRTLIRRVTFDLTGLPPTRDEIQEFLADDAAGAYERLVERLLARPQYGEHMARYWLDAVRFADTNGVHHDHYRDSSPYRDWVIRSFAGNLPYDEFLRDQLAGDLRQDPSPDQLVASGFHRLHLIIDVGTALPEESLARNVIDRTNTFGTVFLGLTVGCAQCHDHKFDPITQRDYYRFAAFFNNLDATPETGSRRGLDFRRGLHRPYVELPAPRQVAERAEVDAAVARAQSFVTFREALGHLIPRPFRAVNAELLEADQESLKRARKRGDDLTMRVPAAMVMRERAQLRSMHVFVRGQYDNPGERVTRGTPAFLPPLRSRGDVPSRLDLADWLLDPGHPLTARVAVNRFWQQLFGVGLVKTSEDFGTQGEAPSHPALLDYLAARFVRTGWDVKALMRAMVTSQTYRRSSVAATADYVSDPDNRLLARGARYRMDAEMIRDQLLATSGLLNGQMFGKSVKPPQPPGIWQSVSLPSSFPRTFTPDTGDQIVRRSLYTFWKRGLPPPQMTILNAPSREACVVRRERTNTPLQALLLLNEPEYQRAAQHLALRALDGEAADAARLRFVYETVTSQLPDERERAVLLASLDALRREYAAAPALAAASRGGAALPAGVDAPTLAAWTTLVSAIYNLDITRTRQ